jgi:ABC-2 type transport system ATP-binding protein
MTQPILTADNLHKHFEEVKAVQGVSFQIAEGEIYSLLGPNGAGKTTTISTLTGLIRPTEGDAEIAGSSVVKDANEVKKAIGVVPQEIALYGTITARENLAFWGRMYGLSGAALKEGIDRALDVAGLADRARDKVETFSGGMKRRLNIAVGLLHRPRIIFMDEPTVGIDPQSRRRILDTVVELNARGMTVLYTTHYMEEAEELSHRIGIIDHGKLIAQGSLAELTDLVGEHDTIRLSLDTGERPVEDLAKEVAGLSGVLAAHGEAEGMLVQAADANAVLPAVLTHLAGAGAQVRSLAIEEPNLEAVFLHLTGRALRD